MYKWRWGRTDDDQLFSVFTSLWPPCVYVCVYWYYYTLEWTCMPNWAPVYRISVLYYIYVCVYQTCEYKSMGINFLCICVCDLVLTCVCASVNDSAAPMQGPPQCPGGLWVVGRGFGFWLCLSLYADITVLMAPNPPFYCTQHFLYKTPTHAHTHSNTHGASNANLAKKKALSLLNTRADIHVCIYGFTTLSHT